MAGDPVASDVTQPAPSPLSLDDIFKRTVANKPGADALFDPADKQRVTGHAPQRMSFQEADRAVTNLASHFVESGLPAGSTIAIQLPNTIEAMLTILAAMRAGLIVALIPLLWRQSELNDALNRVRARSFVTMTRIDGVDHADLAMNAAAGTFSIRHVGAFGDDPPDGISPLSQIMRDPGAHQAFPKPDSRRAGLITCDVTSSGLRIVRRTQLQIIAGGLAVFLDAHLAPGARLMSAVMPSSFAGLIMSLTAWLLCGGSLSLHHPLDPETLATQMAEERCTVLLAPASLAIRMNEANALSRASLLKHVVGLWRTPEQVTGSEDWTGDQIFSDIYAFGEAGMVVARRDANGCTRGLFGPQADRPTAACELSVTTHGTVALRGAMVPVSAYAASGSSEDIQLQETSGHVDTGYAARLDPQSGAITITAPPSGLVSVGGYRFLSRDLTDWAQRLPQGGMLTALPDRMNGFRLAGRAGDNARARAALAELGLNPLMVEAFRDRTSLDHALAVDATLSPTE